MRRDMTEPRKTTIHAMIGQETMIAWLAMKACRAADEALVLKALAEGEGDAAAIARRCGMELEKAANILAELACSPLVWMSMVKRRWRFRLSDLGRASVCH